MTCKKGTAQDDTENIKNGALSTVNYQLSICYAGADKNPVQRLLHRVFVNY